MESSERGEDGLGGGGGGESLIAKPTPSRPTNLNIPPRNPSEAFQKTSDVTPSPLTFVSSFFAEQEPDFKCETFSQMLAGAMSPLPPPSSQSTTGALENGSCVSSVGVEEKPTAAALTSGEPVQRGPAGSASSGRPNVARFKLMTPSRLPIPRSPYLTIPPGLSPTTLLDSPVLLSTKQAEPSPTTGTFPLPPISQGSGSAIVPALDSSSEKSSDQDGGAAFVFKPVAKIGRSPPSPLAKMGTGQPQLQAQGQIGTLVSSGTSSASFWDAPKLVAPLQSRVPVEIASNTAEKTEPVSQPLAPVHPPLVERPSEDGFNWRKYGQKQVKGSEFPRSYYKCTHPNCPVKKKVERSYDGQVTEIVYKGEHNHLKPQSTRRMSMAAHAANGSLRESSYGAVKADGSFEHNVDGVSARSQVVSLSSGATQTPEPSSGSTSDEEVDGEGSKVEDGDDDDPDSKRRKKASGETASIPPLRTIREPRVVVQTTSEVDILDDGYRWRKYGQKVVKGNPHPRSYYKCTNLGCSVRKHVERSSTDIRAVITTYEGKHNHDVPAARNSNNHDNSHGTTAASNPLPSHASLGTSNTIQPARPTPSLQDQYLVGKLLDDRMKGDDRGAGALELGGGHMRTAPLPSRGQGDILMPMQMSFMNPGLSALQRADSIGQSALLRPKDEQDEANLSSSSWPAAFLSSSATHSMTQRLAEGH